MSFNWIEYLALAKAITELNGEDFSREAVLRSAISRAYYSAFGKARIYAIAQRGFVSRGGPEDHAHLIRSLKQGRYGQIGFDLDELRQNRNMCDYDGDIMNLENMASRSFKLAEKICNLV